MRPEDVARVTVKIKEERVKNKAQIDRMHCLRSKKIEEGDWVVVYDNSLDNQNRSTQKFAR